MGPETGGLQFPSMMEHPPQDSGRALSSDRNDNGFNKRKMSAAHHMMFDSSQAPWGVHHNEAAGLSKKRNSHAVVGSTPS